MARRVKAVSHEDRLTLVEHLDELRTRLIVCIVVFGVALALCFWQNHLLLEIAQGPLPDDHDQLITFGVTEPFTTTLTVAAYGAIVLSLPIVLWQLYAYVLPAFSQAERRVVLPILLLFPLLFLAGLAFAYFVVMPAAVNFLLNFNDSQFNVQVRARDYYSFFSMTMIAGGLIFQLPLAILAVTRLGIVSVEQLTENRRYAYLVIAIVAAALPGVDPVSMLIEMVPLLVLYELSILLARVLGRPRRAGGHGQALHAGVGRESGAGRQASTGCSSTSGGRRKHVVKVVYAVLAVLMGASLFLVVGPLNIGRTLQQQQRRRQRRQALRRTGRTDRSETEKRSGRPEAAAGA